MTTLVLSSGGLYAAAHIGVLRCLQEMNLQVDHVVGCSGGALIAAFWALKWTPEQIVSKLSSYNWTIYDLNLWNLKLGLIKGDKLLTEMRQMFTGNVGDYPLTIPITSIDHGTIAAPPSMALADAVRASLSIPVVFRPHVVDGQEYLDGGVGGLLPLRFIPAHATQVLASHIDSRPSARQGRNIVDILYDSYGVMADRQYAEDIEETKEAFPDYKELQHRISGGNLLTSFKRVREYEEIGYRNAKLGFAST